jgi:hypothetical protein
VRDADAFNRRGRAFDALYRDAHTRHFAAWRASILRGATVLKSALSGVPVEAVPSVTAEEATALVNKSVMEAASAEMRSRIQSGEFDIPVWKVQKLADSEVGDPPPVVKTEAVLRSVGLEPVEKSSGGLRRVAKALLAEGFERAGSKVIDGITLRVFRAADEEIAVDPDGDWVSSTMAGDAGSIKEFLQGEHD